MTCHTSISSYHKFYKEMFEVCKVRLLITVSPILNMCFQWAFLAQVINLCTSPNCLSPVQSCMKHKVMKVVSKMQESVLKKSCWKYFIKNALVKNLGHFKKCILFIDSLFRGDSNDYHGDVHFCLIFMFSFFWGMGKKLEIFVLTHFGA